MWHASLPRQAGYSCDFTEHSTVKLLNRSLTLHSASVVNHGYHVRMRVVQEYPWIESEKQFFGRPGSNYDWAATDPQQAFADHEKAADVVERLEKKVNRKVGTFACHWPAFTASHELLRGTMGSSFHKV